MEELNFKEITKVYGGKLSQGDGAGAGSSAGNTVGTSAMKARNPEQGKKALCIGIAAVAVWAPTRPIAAAVVVGLGIACP